MSPLGAPSVAAGDRRAVASGRIFDVDITVSATPGASWGRQVEPPAVSQLVLEAEAPRPETPGAAATRPHAAVSLERDSLLGTPNRERMLPTRSGARGWSGKAGERVERSNLVCIVSSPIAWVKSRVAGGLYC